MTRLFLGAAIALAWAGAAHAQAPTVLCGAGPSGSAAGCATQIAPIVSVAAEASHIFKTTAGNVFSVYAVNQTSTAGFLLVLNANAVPADGAVSPLDCVPLPASGVATINYIPGPPAAYVSGNTPGVVGVVSSGVNCFTKTTGTITAFFHGLIQ